MKLHFQKGRFYHQTVVERVHCRAWYSTADLTRLLGIFLFLFSFLSLLSVRKQRWGLVCQPLLDHIVWSTLPYHIHWKRKIHQIRIDINLFPLIKTYIKTILFNFLIFKKVEFTFVSHSGNFGTLG